MGKAIYGFFFGWHTQELGHSQSGKRNSYTYANTHTESYVFQYGCQLVGTRIGATLHSYSLVQGNPGSSIALRAIERFP